MKKVALLASLVLALSLPSLAQMAGQTGRPGTPGTPGGSDTPGATVPGATSRMPGTSGTNDSQMQNDAKTSSTMKSSKKMGKKMTATGCISEKDGKYMLMNSQHPDGMELMTSENLKPHVGHTVKVTGMMENGSSTSGSSNMGEAMGSEATKSGSAMNSGSSTMNHDSMSMMSMKMTSMKMVSESCTSGMDKSTK